jgi:hypothetical protein
MPSSYTTRIRLEKQADGENANTWGLKLNNNVIDLVDEAVAGFEQIDVSAATSVSLTGINGTTDQSRNFGLKFIGAIDADVTVVMPAVEKIYFVRNDTSGDYNLMFKNAGGTAVTGVGQGRSMMLATDGTNITTMEEPDSTVFASAGTSATLKTEIDANTVAIAAKVSVKFATSASTAAFATSATNATNAVNATNATNATNINISTTGSSSSHRMVFGPANDSAGNQALFKDSAANFYYNPSSNQLNVGSLVASGDVTAFSDKKLKDNIVTLDGTKAFEMRGVSFTKDNKESSGVIAQELEEIAPELVYNDSEYKAVAYGNIVGYLIEAIKHLKEEIEELKGKVNGSS